MGIVLVRAPILAIHVYLKRNFSWTRFVFVGQWLTHHSPIMDIEPDGSHAQEHGSLANFILSLWKHPDG